MNDKLNPNRQPGESELAYIYRIATLRGSIEGLETWGDVTNLLNDQLQHQYDESTYRKKVQSFDDLFNELKEGFLSDEYQELLDKKHEALYKQQIKTRDALREHRKVMRDEARIEVLIDEIKKAAGGLEPIQSEGILAVDHRRAKNEAALLIGDWHIGKQVQNFKNKYDIEIATTRIIRLCANVAAQCRLHNVQTLHVVNLGDMIEGHIHVTARVESEIDTVSQVMKSGELLAWLLHQLGEAIPEVVYHKVLDNHSRITPSFKEHIEKENFGRLTHWWLQERLRNSGSKVQVVEKEIDDNIGLIEYNNGKKAAFVHGHLDEVNTVFQNLGMLLDESLDYVYVGHHHITKMKEFQGGKVFLNGSLCGTDDFLLKKRSFRRPSQLLKIMEGNNEVVIAINLD